MAELAIGIDIGGTNTKWAVVHRDQGILTQGSTSTTAPDNFSLYVSVMTGILKKALQKVQVDHELIGIGIGVPNGNYLTGTIDMPPNLPWGEKVPIAESFEKEFAVPVKVTNDANAAAQGEMAFGNYQPPLKNFILLTIGTGLGSGIVINGQLVHGAHGMAGELGHVQAVDGGRLCGCGLKGCLEAYVSATGIRKTVLEMLEENDSESSLRSLDPGDMSMVDIYEAAKAGDSIALEAFRFSGELLGRRIANSVAHTQPDKILLVGGVMKGKEFFLQHAQEAFEKALFPVYRGKVSLEASASGGDNLAVMGAASLVW